MLGAFLRDGSEAGADLDALDGVDAHHRVRDVGIELVVDRLSPSHGHARRDHFDPRAARVPRLAQRIHELLERVDLRMVRGEEGIAIDIGPALEWNDIRAELRQMAADFDAKSLMQPLARDRASGDAHGGLARRLPAAAAIVANAVFLPIRVVGVAGTKGIGDVRVVLAARILIADQERDRRTGGSAFEHAGQNFDSVGLAALAYMP